MAGAIEDGNDLLELGDGVISDLAAVNGGLLMALVRELQDEVLQSP